jgi:hypothetical protein
VAHYITSKHAVVGITTSLSVELGPRGIRVLAVAPSMTRTEGREEFLARYTTPEMRTLLTEMEQRVPLGRIGVPDDVARVVLFAASDLSMLSALRRLRRVGAVTLAGDPGRTLTGDPGPTPAGDPGRTLTGDPGPTPAGDPGRDGGVGGQWRHASNFEQGGDRS